MALVIKDLGNGQHHVIDADNGKSWVTTPQRNAEDINTQKSEITRNQQRVTDWKHTESSLQAFEDQIQAGTLNPVPGTHPDVYLFEYPTGNFYTGTRDDNLQRINVQNLNHTHVETVSIPEMEAELLTLQEVDEHIGNIPPGGTPTEYTFEGTPLDIASKPDSATSVSVNVTEDFVTFVGVDVDLNHISTEKLSISLISPDGHTVQLAYDDFGSPSDKETFGTWHFNEKTARGTWTLVLINETTSETNILTSATLKIYNE